MKRMISSIDRVSSPVLAVGACLVLILFAVGCASSPGQEVPTLDADNSQVVQQLEQLRNSLETSEPAEYPDVAEQVEQVRETLNQRYENGESQTWQEVEPQLETLEQQLRNESDNAVTTLDQIIETLRDDMVPDAG